MRRPERAAAEKVHLLVEMEVRVNDTAISLELLTCKALRAATSLSG